MSDRHGNWMRTFTGKRYYPIDPRAEDVELEDIAHSLSMQCRYCGHSSRFYSVAEHSVHVSYMVPQEHALAGLFHDATEAYLHDISRPLKGHLVGYHALEAKNWGVIAEKFSLPTELHESIHQADIDVCQTEMAVLMQGHENDYCIPGAVHRDGIVLNLYGPLAAKWLFIERFNALWSGRNGKKHG